MALPWSLADPPRAVDRGRTCSAECHISEGGRHVVPPRTGDVRSRARRRAPRRHLDRPGARLPGAAKQRRLVAAQAKCGDRPEAVAERRPDRPRPRRLTAAADFKAGQIPAGLPAPPARLACPSVRSYPRNPQTTPRPETGRGALSSWKAGARGGANLVPISIQVSIARSIPGSTNGWLAVANGIGAGTPLNWRVQVYAICAKVS
jgi:hypothetical protein